MKNLKFYAIAAIALLCCAACSNSESQQKEDVMTPVSEKISGPLKEYFEIVSRDYKAVETNLAKGYSTPEYDVIIEIKRIKDGFPAPWKEGMTYSKYSPSENQYNFGFTIEFIDDDQNIISKEDWDNGNDSEYKSIIDLDVDETTTITFHSYDSGIEKATQFKISSRFEAREAKASIDDTNESYDTYADNDYTSSSSSSSDWDSVLDSYEKYVNKYVSLAKKISAGDMSAMSEYAEMMEEAQELSTKLSNAQSEMSSAQVKRYMDITSKMATAIQ